MPSETYSLVVGPLLIGVVLNAFVFGLCIMQLIAYVSSDYKDSWKIVGLVSWVITIDAFQVCSSIAMLWHYIVSNFANPAALASGPWEYASLPIFSSLASVPIQHFMAWRIMRFSRQPWMFVYISLLSLAQAGLACASAVQGLQLTSIASHVKIIPTADAWLAVSVACDTSITLLLLYYLSKSRTGFERTDSIISKICRTTVEAAVPVTILCILDLAFLTSTPNNNLHYMFALPVGRLYTNTLMSTLNERRNLRSTVESSTPNRQGISLGAITSKNRFQNVRPAQVHINIEQDVEVQMEELEAAKTGAGVGALPHLHSRSLPHHHTHHLDQHGLPQYSHEQHEIGIESLTGSLTGSELDHKVDSERVGGLELGDEKFERVGEGF